MVTVTDLQLENCWLAALRSGKTEIARRLAKLADAPFIKVSAAACQAYQLRSLSPGNK